MDRVLLAGLVLFAAGVLLLAAVHGAGGHAGPPRIVPLTTAPHPRP